MRVAFYAPLKPPDHAVPSGDRQLARALLAALRIAGHRPEIASRFRSYDGRGDAARQLRLREVGERLAERLIARIRRGAARPDLWFTYHLYHKAPDHLGPAVSRALGIPYVVAEPSVAPKQRDGRWAAGYAAALAAIRAADVAICVNPADLPQVRTARGGGARTDLLPPFIDVASFVGAAPPSVEGRAPDRARVRLVTVAMMREGAKLASYRLLAAALGRLTDLPWDLTVVGDGPARGAVEAAFAGLAPGRARLVGLRPAGEVAALLRDSDLFVWPAIDESFGMALLEARPAACRCWRATTAAYRRSSPPAAPACSCRWAMPMRSPPRRDGFCSTPNCADEWGAKRSITSAPRTICPRPARRWTPCCAASSPPAPRARAAPFPV